MSWNIMDKIMVWVICGILAFYGVYSCVHNPNVESMGKKYSEQEWTPASVCEYQVSFVTTAQYETIEDFWIGVGDTITYLNKNGYRVLDIVPKYGMDITQKEVLKYVYIKYIREVKNESKEKH